MKKLYTYVALLDILKVNNEGDAGFSEDVFYGAMVSTSQEDVEAYMKEHLKTKVREIYENNEDYQRYYIRHLRVMEIPAETLSELNQ